MNDKINDDCAAVNSQLDLQKDTQPLITAEFIEENYKEAVYILSKNKSPSEFSNKGKGHAAIVLQHMLDTTEDCLKIFSGSLCGEVTDAPEFLKSLNRYLGGAGNFQLLLEKMPLKKSKALDTVLLAAANKGLNASYKVATNAALDELKKTFVKGKLYHFAVSDGRAFRLEVNPNEFTAVVNFNDTEAANKLEKAFDSAFSK